MVGLLATDLAFTLHNVAFGLTEKQIRHNQVFNVAWQVVYWSNFLFGTVLKKVYVKYWMSGHFTLTNRAKHVCRQLSIELVVMCSVGCIAIGVGYYYLRESLIEIVQISLILLGNIYGMCVLVLLLAYGVAFIPVSLYKQANLEQRLYNMLLEAQSDWQEFRDARLDYMKQISLCHDLVNYKDDQNQHYVDMLLSELPEHDLDGDRIYVSNAFKV